MLQSHASQATRPLQDTAAWATEQWGECRLGHPQRTQRVVRMGQAMADTPSGSIPQQMQSAAATKGAYRLLNAPDVTLAALSQPHWERTRQTSDYPTVLQVQDTTDLDYTRQKHIRDLGSIGNQYGRGLLLHSVLSVAPTDGTVLGLAHQHVLLRQPKVKGQPWPRSAEGRVWETAVQALGAPPPAVRWVHVGDRLADNFGFLSTCDPAAQVHCLVRLMYNRQLAGSNASPQPPPGSLVPDHLLDYARQWPAAGAAILVDVAARQNQPKRTATVCLSWGAVRVAPPARGPLRQHAPIEAWVVRAWEPNPPKGVEALEWLLLTSVPVTSWADAQERVGWYARRWLVEDYHKALKTGCRLEHSQLDCRADIERLIGLVGPVAVRLLQLRQRAQQAPDRPAFEAVDRLAVVILAKHLKLDPSDLTLDRFWRGVAQLGGYLGRGKDGPPGWQSVWRGWSQLRLLVDGARLALGLHSDDILLLNSP